MVYFFLPNSLTIYDIKNWTTVLFLEKINPNYNLINFATFFYYNKENEYFIITSNDKYTRGDTNLMVLDLNGKVKKENKNIDVLTLYIKTYYNDNNDKTYIMVLNNKNIKSFDYENNSLYQKYFNKDIKGYSLMDIIKTKDGVIQLITSCAAYGLILIWNFDTGYILNQIQINEKFFTMFFYNERVLFIGTMTGNIIIMDILSQINNSIYGVHGNYINCINKFCDKKEGKYLITQGNDNVIKIYKIKSKTIH